MHLPLTPNHVLLVSACYPPSAALLTAGPDYKPNSQELSRLTYYASNRPGKITKLSNELQKRVFADSRKALSGNMRSRASLLLTLAIFKALITECKRDMSLLSAALMCSLDKTLSALPYDLEVAARVATVFATWTTYTDGHLIGVDASITRDYVATLKHFVSMCTTEAKSDDYEERNRTRLVGLGALTGSVTSGALYNSSTEFKSQVSIITPALLLTLQQADLSVLNEETEVIRSNPLPLTSYISDSRSRPTTERRAASIYAHVDGDKGPSIGDVANSALRAFSSLLSQSNGPQVGYVIQAALNCFQHKHGWGDIEHCCWFAQTAIQWTQYQYRYAVPTRLVERLSDAPDDPTPSSLHKALVAMIKTVFTSPTPLVNLSTSDIISNLISLVLRRVSIDPHDSLLPDLVECIAALGAHIYYADQIHDLAGELISRLVSVEMNGFPGIMEEGKMRGSGRPEALRCLIAGLVGLIRAVDKPSDLVATFSNGQDSDQKDQKLGSTPATLPEFAVHSQINSPLDVPSAHPLSPRRTKIPPEAWQDTLTLLCDADFPVRADYARALATFLCSELPKEQVSMNIDPADEDGVKRARPPAEIPLLHAQTKASSVFGENETSRFLNAMHASVFVLATSSTLGLCHSSTPSPSDSIVGKPGQGLMNVNVIPSTPPVLVDEPTTNATTEPSDMSQQTQGPRRRSVNITPQARKLSVARRLLNQASVPSSITTLSASLSDYVNILHVLTAVHEQLPSSALLNGVPMLLALQNFVKLDIDDSDANSYQKQRIIEEVIARVWLVIGRVWGCSELVGLVEKTLPQESWLSRANVPTANPMFPSAEEPTWFNTFELSNKDNAFTPVDHEVALSTLASNRNAQSATGLDGKGLLKRLASPWTPEMALKHSVERSTNHSIPKGEVLSPVLKISPALMHIENLSLQSLTRSTRGVGVSDLRDALEGRSGMSNLALVSKAPSLSSLEHAAYSVASGDSRTNEPGRLLQSRSRTKRTLNGESPTEVRDVLNKLGIGLQNGNNLLKSSFPPKQQPDSRSTMLVPPYKS